MRLKASDKMDLWKKYLILLGADSKKALTPKEAEIMAFAMAQPVTIENPLRGNSRKQLKEKLNITEQTLSMHRSNMVDKGWIVNDNILPFLQEMRRSFTNSNSKGLKLEIEIYYD